MKGALGVEGFEPAQERLAAYLRSGRIHPAIVLVGPEGEERWHLAKNIAKSLLCIAKVGSSAFCGRCSTCRRIESESYPDLTLSRSSDEPIKIEWIRGLCYEFQLSPLEGVGKVCIIENSERLNVAASNALLKTLEEPPADRYFLLLTSKPATLLPTVASRCLFFGMGLEDGQPLTPPTFAFDSIEQAVHDLDSREKCADYVTQIQTKLRAQVLELLKQPESDGSGDSLDSLLARIDQFEESCSLQWRLRSQANYGLLLETFLRDLNSSVGML